MCFTSSKAPPPTASRKKSRLSQTTVSAMTNFTISEFFIACRLKSKYKSLIHVRRILPVARTRGKNPAVPSRKVRGSDENARTKAWLVHREMTCSYDRFCETKTTFRAQSNIEQPKRHFFPELMTNSSVGEKKKKKKSTFSKQNHTQIASHL